jgi:hypothetical protein
MLKGADWTRLIPPTSRSLSTERTGPTGRDFLLIYPEDSVDVLANSSQSAQPKGGSRRNHFEIAHLKDFFLGTNISASVSPHLFAIW